MSKHIDAWSGISVYVEPWYQRTCLASATAFIVNHSGMNKLVTNWHVLAGKNPETEKILDSGGQCPDSLHIWFHGSSIGEWVQKSISLIGLDGLSWIQHPRGPSYDVAYVPLPSDTDYKIYPLDLSSADVDLEHEIAMPVSIIGFPHGISGPGKFPIWKVGSIASEPDLDYEEKPVFLIDATTREGMSGAPVIIRMTGGFRTRNGSFAMATGGPRTRFLGIYSGRLRTKYESESASIEIGKVWKPSVIQDLLQSGTHA